MCITLLFYRKYMNKKKTPVANSLCLFAGVLTETNDIARDVLDEVEKWPIGLNHQHLVPVLVDGRHAGHYHSCRNNKKKISSKLIAAVGGQIIGWLVCSQYASYQIELAGVILS